MNIQFIDDDENIKAMRETARTIGLTQLLLDVCASAPGLEEGNFERLTDALLLLGVEPAEVWTVVKSAEGPTS